MPRRPVPAPVPYLRRPRQPARPWPLLAPDQDPASIEARVAFHLHRLRLTGKTLRDCGFCQGHKCVHITQARIALAPSDARRLSGLLGIPEEDLTRPLTDEETVVWAFYRASAANAGLVWQRAHALWRDRMTTSTAAAIMKIDRAAVVRNIRPNCKRGYRVLTYPAALRLCRTLGVFEGPRALLNGLSLAPGYRRDPRGGATTTDRTPVVENTSGPQDVAPSG